MTPLAVLLGILGLAAGLIVIILVALSAVWLIHLFVDVIPDWVNARR